MSHLAIMDQGFQRRLDFIDLVYGGKSVPEAAKQMGFSSTYGYKIRKKFVSGGPLNLKTKSPIPKRFPRKIKDDLIIQLVQSCLLFPDKGVQWISKKLLEMENVAISSGTIYTILKNHNLETRSKRLNWLFQRIEIEGQAQQPRRTLQGMEAMSHQFRDRSFVQERLGRHIFVWTEHGRISHSRLRIWFDIFLDGCGSIVNIVPNVNTLLNNARKSYENSDLSMIMEPGHYLYGSTKKVLKLFYSYFNISAETICVLGDKTCHEHFLESQLAEFYLHVITLPPDKFFKVSFVQDFKKVFKWTFLRRDLRKIRHNRVGIETAEKVQEALNRFLELYNHRNIDTWPNLGRSPYSYAGEKYQKSFHLPAREEVRAKPGDQNEPEAYNRDKDKSIS